jgi:hypothetical protein
MSISILNKYQEVRTDKVLANVFAFGLFLENSGLQSIMKGYGAVKSKNDYNLIVIRAMIEELIEKFNDTFNRNVTVMIANLTDSLMEICFEQYFAKYIRDEFRESFNNDNISQINQVKQGVINIVKAVETEKVFNAAGNLNVKGVSSLPDPMFAFGEGLYVNVGAFDTTQFKTKIAGTIATAFMPFFYMKHLKNKMGACNDTNQRCKRIYKLAQYVFLYYTTMSIFLIVFSSADSMDKYKKDTNENDIGLQEKKQKLVYMMDSILLKMNEATLPEKGQNKEISEFYDSVRRMSLDNVQKSNEVVQYKHTIETLQNNLKNYNAMENITADQLLKTKISFYVHLVLWFAVCVYVFGATFSRHLFAADMVTLIAALVLLYCMIDPRRQYRIQRIR